MLLLFTLLAPQGYCLVFCALGRFVCHIRRGGHAFVPYPQRWAGLGAISAQVDRFVCHTHRGGQVCVPYPHRWAGLYAISTMVGRFVCHIHRGGHWAGLYAISVNVGGFWCRIHKQSEYFWIKCHCHNHRGGQVWVPYPQRWADLCAISAKVGRFR